MFGFILLQLFARVQEITLQQNYLGVAYANLRLSCMVQTNLKRSGMDHTAFNLQRTPYACLYLVHQMAPPLNVVANI